jgi:hypothetical protein
MTKYFPDIPDQDVEKNLQVVCQVKLEERNTCVLVDLDLQPREGFYPQTS